MGDAEEDKADNEMLGTLSDSDMEGGDGEESGTRVLDWLSVSDSVGDESPLRDEEEETDRQNWSGREREVELRGLGHRQPWRSKPVLSWPRITQESENCLLCCCFFWLRKLSNDLEVLSFL